MFPCEKVDGNLCEPRDDYAVMDKFVVLSPQTQQ